MYVDFHDMDERTGINERDKEVLTYGEKNERVVTLLRLFFVLDVCKAFCCLVLVFSFFFLFENTYRFSR